MGLLLAIHGDGGSAAIIDEELTFLYASDGAPPPIEMSDSGAPYSQVNRQDPLDPTQRTLGRAHADQLGDLVATVRARRTGDLDARPTVGSADGRRALALVLGMYESARTDRPVRLT